MRAKERNQGRFVALSGLKKLVPPPGSQYPLLVIDSAGSPVFFLCEWYRRKYVVPEIVVFFFAQRYFVRGIVTSGLKG